MIKLRDLIFLLSSFTLINCGGNDQEVQNTEPTQSQPSTEEPIQPEPHTDVIPDSFSFEKIEDTQLQETILSHELTIKGLTSNTTIEIENGEYSINNEEFTTNSGTISNNQKLVVRHISSDSIDIETTSTLIVGGISTTFTSVTRSTQPVTMIPGCRELYDSDCLKTEDWEATLWSDDLTTPINTHPLTKASFFPEADNKEIINISFNGTSYLDPEYRFIKTVNLLGVDTTNTYIAAPILGTGLDFSPENTADCKKITLTLNNIPVDELGAYPEIFTPSTPNSLVTIQEVDQNDQDSSQDFLVSTCIDTTIIIAYTNPGYSAEFDTSNIETDGNISITLENNAIPISISVNNRDHYFNSSFTGFSSNTHFSNTPAPIIDFGYLSQKNQFNIFNFPTILKKQYYSYKASLSQPYYPTCPAQDNKSCYIHVESINHIADETNISIPTTNIGFYSANFIFSEANETLSVIENSFGDANYAILDMEYWGNIDDKYVGLHRLTYFNPQNEGEIQPPPLPPQYQEWVDDGSLRFIEAHLHIYNDSRFSASEYSSVMSRLFSKEGVKAQAESTQTYQLNSLRISEPEEYFW